MRLLQQKKKNYLRFGFMMGVLGFLTTPIIFIINGNSRRINMNTI